MRTISFDVDGLDAATIAMFKIITEGGLAALRHEAAPATPAEHPLVHGWDETWVRPFIARVSGRGGKQAAVIEAIAAAGGEIDRATLMDIAGFRQDRNLTGFTKPVKGALRHLMTTAGLTAGADDDRSLSNPLRPDYRNGPGRATHFVMDRDLATLFHRVLGHTGTEDR